MAGSTGGSRLLEATGVVRRFHRGDAVIEALRGIDLVLDHGAFVAITGPSGSGKTTLLNCLSGLDDIDEGSVHLEGRSLTDMSDRDRTARRAETMGFVFQDLNLIPVFTAVENVELALLIGGTTGRPTPGAATDALDRVGLGDRRHHLPSMLSGGEQQRVAIARALVAGPRLVWADEPTGSLDDENAAHVLGLFQDLNRDGMSVVLITHDRDLGAAATRHVEMSGGRIVRDEPTLSAPR